RRLPAKGGAMISREGTGSALPTSAVSIPDKSSTASAHWQNQPLRKPKRPHPRSPQCRPAPTKSWKRHGRPLNDGLMCSWPNCRNWGTRRPSRPLMQTLGTTRTSPRWRAAGPRDAGPNSRQRSMGNRKYYRPFFGNNQVESRCGAVSVGRTYLFPPLSSGGALVVRPWLRFHIPLIEPDVQISRIRLSDKTSRLCFGVRRHLRVLNPSWSL